MARLYAKHGKRAQIKIQETAFMLLALAILFVLLFIIFSNLESKKLYKEKNELRAKNAISMLQLFATLPEFAALEGNGIDLDKVMAMKNVTGYDPLWREISKIQVLRIYPNNSLIPVYDKTKAGASYTTYAAYIPLCYTKFYEGSDWQQCDLGKILVSVEELKQK
jgi:hypothetical protein